MSSSPLARTFSLPHVSHRERTELTPPRLSASSEGKAKASKPAKSSRKSLRGQKKPKSSLAADVDTPTPKRKKKATFADASPSSQGHFPHLEQYMSEMKAYFADVDAYELQEE